jgi:methylthioribose-1-phosphate isomerase
MQVTQSHTASATAAEQKTVWWDDEAVCLLDQTRLPFEAVVVRCATVEAVAEAIASMQVRGAPAIGVTAAYGLALAARRYPALCVSDLQAEVERAAAVLGATRPTAINLQWALDRQLRLSRGYDGTDPDELADMLLDEAILVATEDEAACRAIGRHGAALLPAGARALTHCNTGSLATVVFGTALGVLRTAHAAGRLAHVWVDETRPRLQGARLTAWELQQAGIPCTLIADNMAASLMARGLVDCVIVGCDRVAANGDTANKIGTYSLAVLAHYHGIPFYVAGPTSSIDLRLPDGSAIPIEERPADEMTHIGGHPIAPLGVPVANPAFDVTPAHLITAIITEQAVASAPYGPALARMVGARPAPPSPPTPLPADEGRVTRSSPAGAELCAAASPAGATRSVITPPDEVST